jgi:hypothetical protein
MTTIKTQDSQCPVRDLNPASPEYDAGVDIHSVMKRVMSLLL